MAISVVTGKTGSYTGGGLSTTWSDLGPGSGVSEGDIILVAVVTESTHVLDGVQSGWVQLGTTVDAGGSVASSLSVLARRAGPSEAGLVTVKFTASRRATPGWCVLTGVDGTTMLDVAVVTGTHGFAARCELGVTTSTAGAGLVMINGTDPSSTIDMTYDVGITEVLDVNTSGTGHLDIGFRVQPTAAATSMGGDWNVSRGGASLLLAFKQAVGVAAQDLAPNFIGSTSQVFEATVAAGAAQSITAGFVASSSAVPSPTIGESTPQAVAPDLLSSPGQVFSPSLGSAVQSLAPDVVASSASVPGPSLTDATPQAVTPNVVAASSQVFDAELANVATPTLTPDLIASVAEVYGPSLSRTAHSSLTAGFISSDSVVSSPTVGNATHSVLGPDLVVSTVQIYPPLLRPEGETRGVRGTPGSSTRASAGTAGVSSRGSSGSAGSSTRDLVGAAGGATRDTLGSPGTGSDR